MKTTKLDFLTDLSEEESVDFRGGYLALGWKQTSLTGSSFIDHATATMLGAGLGNFQNIGGNRLYASNGKSEAMIGLAGNTAIFVANDLGVDNSLYYNF